MPETAARPSARDCRPCGMRRGYDSHMKMQVMPELIGFLELGL
jgi:hypothetical protein